MHRYTICDAEGNPQQNLTSTERVSSKDILAYREAGHRLRKGHQAPKRPDPNSPGFIQEAVQKAVAGETEDLVGLLYALTKRRK